MFRTTLDKTDVTRPLRPIYAQTQATPQHFYLNPAYDLAASPAIYPGMVMMKGATGDQVTLIDNTGKPLGLAGIFRTGDVHDEIDGTGLNACPVWVLGPDAEFEIDVPSFDDGVAWTLPTNGTDLLIHAQTAGANRGKLVPAGTSGASTDPVARLVKIVSERTIVIGGLPVRA